MAKRLIDAEDVKELLKGLDSLPWEEEVDDLVDSLETVELENGKCSDCTRRKFYQKGYEDGLNASKWISVSERLPGGCDDAEIEVLISVRELYPDAFIETSGFALYYPETKTFHSVYGDRLDITEIVTAWKYLPEPYREKVTE